MCCCAAVLMLLVGTPIQNSLGELWSLLHFIMPHFFDSINDFRDWFVNDIDKGYEDYHECHDVYSHHECHDVYSHHECHDVYSHHESMSVFDRRDQSAVKSHQLSRLHSILKPFMLRRVKVLVSRLLCSFFVSPCCAHTHTHTHTHTYRVMLSMKCLQKKKLFCCAHFPIDNNDCTMTFETK